MAAKYGEILQRGQTLNSARYCRVGGKIYAFTHLFI